MARLAIAKDFLAEYAKLEKSVQSAVESAIAKFAEHTHAGLHLEKLHHSRDDRIRTIRVDSFWRGVVLAPDSGDTYCLVTVLPHDKANAFATSHRFTVNQALGVLEVRNEEAIQRLEPTLAVVARHGEKRLFADFNDRDLTRLGVDAQVLPLVRLLTSDAHLEALQTMLPEAQYAALYSLACGMTVEEAWAEVAQLLPGDTRPEAVDPSDLVSAMQRSPGQVAFVSGSAELQRILAHPFAAWRTFLHPSQRRIAHRASYTGPARVTGGAGTGKTVTALHRAAFLAERAASLPPAGPVSRPDRPAPSILLTTFTRNLAEALDAQLTLLIEDDSIRSWVETLNVDRLAYRVVRQAHGTPAIADDRVLRGWWMSAAAASNLPFTPVFLKQEWEQVILAQDLHTERAYLTCLRTGRGRPLSKTQRALVWQAAQHVTAKLAAARQSTYFQLANEATHILRHSLADRYQHVIVDEAQDLHPSQWRLLRAAVAPGPNDLFIADDPRQRIYDNRVSLASLDIQVRGRSRRLNMNYRTTQEILAWAVPLLGRDPIAGLDGETDSMLGYRSPMHGQRPHIHRTSSREEELTALVGQIRAWLDGNIEPHAIGVAARATYLAKGAREAIRTAGIPAASLVGSRTTEAVRVGTMHGMKGLEFQAVAVIGVDHATIPAAAAVTPAVEDPLAHAQDLQRERCVLFVACTRARDHLYVSHVGEPSQFLHPQPRRP